MKKKYTIEEWEFDVIVDSLESVLGYCGTWGEKDVIECKKPSGHATSMCVDVFLNSLKSRFEIIN